MSFLVLIVDDTDQCRELACHLVSALGYRAISADCGASAIEQLGTVESNRPLILLTDYYLPDMNGFELCRMVKASTGAATILCSGDPELLNEQGQNDHVVDVTLEKPYTWSELRNALEYASTVISRLDTGISSAV